MSTKILKHKFRENISKYRTFGLILLLTIFYVYHDITKWSVMKSLNSQGAIIYADASTVLQYSRCFKNIGVSVFLNGEICSNWNNSASVLRLIGILNLQDISAQLIGKVFTYFSLLTFCILVYLTRRYLLAQVTIFLGLISPPVWLLLERGNIDTLMYLLVFLSTLIYAQGYRIFPITLISISSILKFYTLPLLVLTLIKSRGIYIKLFNLMAISVSSVIIVLDLRLLDRNNIIQAGNNHFGLKIIGNYLGKLGIEMDSAVQYLLSGFLFVVSIAIVYLVTLRVPFINSNNSNLLILKFLHLFSCVLFISIYLIGLSVDYKLIFIFSTAPFLIIHTHRKFRYSVSLLFLVSVWFTYPTGFFQTIGDFALQMYMAIQVVFMLQATRLPTPH